MSYASGEVSSKVPLDPSLSYLQSSTTWQAPQKTCVVCNRTEPLNEELLKLCTHCHETLDRYVHMKCFSKLESYVSRSGITHVGMRRCPTPECTTVAHLIYNATTIDFPNYKNQVWLYYANPALWILADLASLAFFVAFTECYTHGGDKVCYAASYGVHGLSMLLYLLALLLKTTDATLYLDISKSKKFAKQKVFTEIVLVSISIIIGLTTFSLMRWLNEVSPPFAIWILIYVVFILPIVGTHFIHSHAKMYSRIRSTVVEIQPVSLFSGRSQQLDM